MAKNISRNSFKIVTIVVTLLFANGAVWGQRPHPYFSITTEVNGLLDLNHPAGDLYKIENVGSTSGWYYDPLRYDPSNPNSFPASHITSKNNPILHWTGSSIDAPGTYVSSDPFAVIPYGNTATAANKLWDKIYSIWGYTKIDPIADIDTSQNCHGYSTGKNTWMSLSPVQADDYVESNEFDALVSDITPYAILATTSTVLASIPNGTYYLYFGVNSHSARIAQVGSVQTNPSNGNIFKIIEVQEKNRVSALYTRDDFIVSKDPANPGKIKPIVLPWSTLPKFHIKK